MKKLLVAAMGIAAAYGAFADPFSVGKRFEDLTVGETVTTNELNEAAGGTFWTDPVGATNTYTVKTMDAYEGSRPVFFDAAPTKALEVKTTFGSPLKFNFKEGDTQTIGEDGLYFDSLVKFTVCDGAPEDKEAYNNAKIMMWLQSDDDTVTNIVIKAGYLTYSAGKVGSVATNYTCYTVGGAFADNWHRVTIKAIADITSTGDGVPGFVVFIDGNMVNVPGTYEVWGAGFPARTAKADHWETNKALFPSMVQSGIGIKDSLSAVEFDGTGYLNDVTVTETAPAFAVEPAAPEVAVEINGVPQVGVLDFAGAVTAVNSADYGEVANPSATITLSKGATIGEALEFTAEATITIDFAGFVLTNTLADAMITNSAAKLIVTNSTGIGGIYCTNADTPAIYQSAAAASANASLAIVDGYFWADLAVAVDEAYEGSREFISGGAFASNMQEYLVTGKTLDENPVVTELGEVYPVVDAPEPEPTWADVLGEAVAGAYQIDNLAELKAFQANVGVIPTENETFELTTDIALDAAWPGIGIQNGKDLVSYTVGTQSGNITKEEADRRDAAYEAGAFKGTFDGQNHTISGFQIIGKGDNTEGLDYAGFFNSTLGATIQNLKIQYAGSTFAADTTSGTKESGATFVGVAKDSTLRNLTTVAGAVSCSKGFGGIVGYLYGTTVDSCTNNVNMTSLANNKCGGIAMICQKADCSISNCENNGTMTTSSQEHGGIVGYTDTITINNCKNTAACKMFYHHGGTVTLQGTNTGNATVQSYTGNATPGLKFATVNGSVATFVADDALAAGNTYKVMATNVTATYVFAAAGTIAFDTALFTPTYAITAGSGLELTDATEAGVKTYTAATQYTITYTDTDGSAFTDWADNYVAPTTFTATRIATLPTTSDVNVERVGVEFAGWTNALGNAVTTTEGLSANLEVFAKFNTVVVGPTINPDSDKPAEVAGTGEEDAQEIANSVPVTIPAEALAAGVDGETYQTYFDKSATYNSTTHNWEVTAKIAATVEETAAETAAAILTEESTTGKVTVPTGLYYKVTRMEELGTPVEDPVTGISDGEGVSVTKPGTTQGFIQVEISTSSFE